LLLPRGRSEATATRAGTESQPVGTGTGGSRLFAPGAHCAGPQRRLTIAGQTAATHFGSPVECRRGQETRSCGVSGRPATSDRATRRSSDARSGGGHRRARHDDLRGEPGPVLFNEVDQRLPHSGWRHRALQHLQWSGPQPPFGREILSESPLPSAGVALSVTGTIRRTCITELSEALRIRNWDY